MTKFCLTEHEFVSLINKTRIQQKTRDALRLVIIEGFSQKDAAAKVGISNAAVNVAVKKIRTLHLTKENPMERQHITLVVPKELSEPLKKIEAQIRDNPDIYKKKKDRIIKKLLKILN